jgi:hypothetical protein
VDETTCDWTIQGASFTSPNQTVLLGSTFGDTTIQANQSGGGGLINFLGGAGMIAGTAGTATVKRREDREVTGAVVLEAIEMNDTFAYCIQYDEEPHNAGWWLEAELLAE